MDEGWNNNNTSFSDLLANVEMAAVESGSGNQRESNSWNDDIDYTLDIPQYEFPDLYRCSYDHNFLPETLADIASNGSIPFQLAPETPDVGKRAQQSHPYDIRNVCQEEGSYLEKNKKQDEVYQIGYNTSGILCEETVLVLQYEPNISSVAASTQLEENDVLDNGKEETGIDLQKTPVQKAKKRKIRPRVVLEGNVKGTPKSNVKDKLNDSGAKKTPKSKVKENSKDSEARQTPKSNVKEKSNGENQPGKRRYTRKNESKFSNAHSTDVVEEATMDQVVVKSCKRKLRLQYEGTRLTLLAGSETPPPDRCTGFNGSVGTNHNTVDSNMFSSMSSVLHGAREAMGCRQSDVNASPSTSHIRGQLELTWPYHLIDGSNNFSVAEQNAVVPYGVDGRMVPYEGLFDPSKKRLLRAKVDLDPEDDRVWKLLMGIDTSNGVEGTSEDKEEWWKKERLFFRERADSFIARMHLIQGNRRFSKWNGSVLDSVVGVYLTQNVSDHLSSSAFISLAARFPLKSTCYKGPEILVEEPEVCTVNSDDSINWQENMLSKPVSDQGFVALHEAEHIDEHVTGNCKESFESNIRDASMDDICKGTERWCGSLVEAEDKRELDVLSSQGSVGSSQNFIDSFIFPNVEKNLSKERGSDQEDNDMGMLEDAVSSQDFVDSSILSIDELASLCSKRDPTTCCTSKSSSQVMQQAHSTSTNFQGETLHETTKSDSKSEGSLEEEENKPFDWDSLRKEVYGKGLKREKTKKTMDSLDWEAVRCADVGEIAKAIKERGMNNILAGRIKDFLNRLVTEHESLDLEWLRDVPPDKAKDYLLSIKGVGLKSTECVRLLTLHHHAFPVDTNVGRVVVRLGWVPLQPLPESFQLHLLEIYPIMESIQKYLWPRLCTLDQPTLYELHYQMITFGKVFCTKLKPNCNACPMKAECKHYASQYASARFALPGPEEKGIVTSFSLPFNQNSTVMSTETMPVHLLEAPLSETIVRRNECEPIIEEPKTMEDESTEIIESDIEDVIYEYPNEIPSINLNLNLEELTLNLQNYVQKNNMEIQESEVSKALVVVSSQVAAIPVPKLKNVNRLRTEHQVYELPDVHPLLEGVARRDPDDHCRYLFAIWSPGETAESFQPPEKCCSSQESSNLCNKKTCFLCNSIHEAKTKTVRGTLLIPCRTAMRGSFPLNGTYFQVNEVFADHETSLNPINVPREWIGLLPKRSVLFGTSITTIVNGLSTEKIQECFSKGYICVRGFDQKLRLPRPLVARLHFPPNKIIKNKTTKNTL